MPWAMHEPKPLAETSRLLERGVSRFLKGEDFMYSILNPDETEVLGGSGLHRCDEPGCLEIGYWIRADRLGKGFATEAARALSRAALEMPEIARVQIDCDPANRSSRRVPEKLGYQLIETLRANKSTASGQPRDTVVYQITAIGQLASGVDRRSECC